MFDTVSLLGLRNKIIEKLGTGVDTAVVLEVIAEHFKLPTYFETCTKCQGRGRIPWDKTSVPCPQCYMGGQMKVTTWELP